MVVVDASAAFLALIHDGEARLRLAFEELHAPYLIDSELANAFRKAELNGRFSGEALLTALDRWRLTGVRRHPAVRLLPRIWQLRRNATGYDATYIALAERLNCPLLVSDRKLARMTGHRAITELVTT